MAAVSLRVCSNDLTLELGARVSKAMGRGGAQAGLQGGAGRAMRQWGGGEGGKFYPQGDVHFNESF